MGERLTSPAWDTATRLNYAGVIDSAGQALQGNKPAISSSLADKLKAAEAANIQQPGDSLLEKATRAMMAPITGLVDSATDAAKSASDAAGAASQSVFDWGAAKVKDGLTIGLGVLMIAGAVYFSMQSFNNGGMKP